eukprot:448788-Prorocentrum_minimum.AAC.2
MFFVTLRARKSLASVLGITGEGGSCPTVLEAILATTPILATPPTPRGAPSPSCGAISSPRTWKHHDQSTERKKYIP